MSEFHCKMGKHILVACLLFMVMIQGYSQDDGSDHVNFKRVDDAEGKRAVCIDGSAAGYFHAPGTGTGANNWLLFLMGGGWCWEGLCAQRVHEWNGSAKNATYIILGGLLSSNETLNPDFHNWNRVYVYYCDGGSFLGDNEAIDNGTLVQLRGSRIYDAVMAELLEKGMKNADNVIFSGGSAGGLAVILHCDDFRALLPNVNRVKCLSDGGVFLHGPNLPFAWRREWMNTATVKIHNLTSFLPSSCTSKREAGLCLFPEYLLSDVKTPIFLLNSVFDAYQIHDQLNVYPTPPDWHRCTTNTSTCTPEQAQVIKDFGSTMIAAIDNLSENPSRGLLLNACSLHGMMDFNDKWDNKAYGLEDMTIRQAFVDWFFDRSNVTLITQDTFPKTCG